MSLHFREYDGSLAPLGERTGKMLIYQPPINTVDVEISCCQDTSINEDDFICEKSEDEGGEQRLRLRNERQQAWLAVRGGRLCKVKNENGVRLRELGARLAVCGGGGGYCGDGQARYGEGVA